MKINDLYESDNEETVDYWVSKIKKSPFYHNVLNPQLKKLKEFDPEILNHDFTDEHFHNYVIENLQTLYHGTRRVDETVTEITLREREAPLDTSLLVHNTVNKMAKEKFGINIRNGMFASQDALVTKSYGATTMLIPLGDYRIFYTPGVTDFTDKYRVAAHNDFGADMIFNIIDQVSHEANEQKLLRKLSLSYGSVDDNEFVMRLFENVPEYKYYDSFDDIFKTIVGVASENIRGTAKLYDIDINDEQVKKISRWVEETVKVEIDQLIDNLKQYVDSIVETKNLDDIYKDEEIIVWFDKALIVLTSSSDGIGIIKQLLKDA